MMRPWCILTVVFWLAAGPLPGIADDAVFPLDQSLQIRGIEIRINEERPSGFDWEGLARAVIDVEIGDRFSNENMEKALAALAPFAEVDTQVTASSSGITLAFDLKPFKRIKTMAIHSNYPLFDQEVRNVMTVAPGTFFHPSDVPEQKELIARRYRNEGYIDPRVRITWEVDEEDGHYHLLVSIDKGPFYRLTKVAIKGNRAFGDSALKSRMRTWRRPTGFLGKSRFIRNQLDDDVQRLTDYYRSKGYADVSVRHNLTLNAAQHRAGVEIAINEGHRYDIVFQGNDALSDRILRKELALTEIGNLGNIGLRRSVRNIRRRYLESGFADVQVGLEEVESGDSEPPEVRRIRFQVEEGLRHVVQRISITGNTHMREEEIREAMLTRTPEGLGRGLFVRSVLEEDLEAIRTLYYQKGYIHTRVNEELKIDPDTKAVDLLLDIDEGPQTRVGKIRINGQTPVSESELQSALTMHSGDLYLPHQVGSDENALAARIAPLGYPHVQVSGEAKISADRTRADIVYTIDSGPFVQVGRIFLAGNFRTDPEIMRRELNFSRGDPFALDQVLKAQRSLRDLDIFETVQARTIGLKEKSSIVHLLFETFEKKPYYLELGGGYQTDKGVYVRTRVGDHNFQGSNKDIWLGGEVSEVGYRFETGLSDPRVLGTRFRADLSLFTEREELFNQDFGVDTSGGSLGFSRQWGPRITTALSWRYEYREQFLREPDADVDPETLEPRSILVTTPLVRYDSRDSFIRPRKGWLGAFSVDISTGLENSLDNFLRYKLDLRTFHTPIDRLTLAGAVRVGYLTAYGENAEVPKDQLFFLGGTTDVRGYEENLLRYDEEGDPVGGRLALSGSLEGRYDLGRNWELAVFVDTGSLRKARQGDDQEKWRWSVGLGLRYITPIGPIGLLYGHKIDPRPGESSGQFHFSIGYTF